MEPLFQMMRDEFPKKESKVPLAENDEMIEALGPDRSHEPFRVGVTVRAARRDSHGLHAT